MSVPYPDHLREEVERYLEEMRFAGEGLTEGLEQAMRYSLLAGGKRIRPVLSLATAEAVGMDRREVLPLAGAAVLQFERTGGDATGSDDDQRVRGRRSSAIR